MDHGVVTDLVGDSKRNFINSPMAMPIHKKKKKTRCLTVVVKLTSSQSLNSVE